MICSKGHITFSRGDDDSLLVGLNDGLVFSEGDRVFFSVKAEENDLVDIFQVESTQFVEYNETESAGALITIPHESTISMELASYFYDILIEWADGTYVTVVPPSKFKLVAGGSHDES
jgi:hypothetical protein